MACDNLTTGRSIGCYDFLGGVKAVYLSTNNLGDIRYDATNSSEITTFGGAPEFFKYTLDGVANAYTENLTKTVGNGTKFYAQSLVIQLAKMDKRTRDEFELLASAKPTVIVEDWNSQFFVCGLDNGMDMTAGGMQTGGARGDFNGYNVTLTAETKLPATFLVNDILTTTATVSAVNIEP